MIFWTLKEAEGDFLGLLADPNQDFLAPQERQRLAQMKIEKRRKEWLLGRITAKALLTSEGLPFAGQPLSSIEIDNHPEGAPYISNTQGSGNISIGHRDDIAVAAFTPQNNIRLGIDLETIETREMNFVEDFFTKVEADYTQSLAGEIQSVWTTLVWSAKEAILKAWQKGLRLDTRSIEIQPIPATELSVKHDNWQIIQWRSKIDGYPDCWLGWQRWKTFVLTLAYTTSHGSNLDIKPQISQVLLNNFPVTN